jgi:hypothetical protein
MAGAILLSGVLVADDVTGVGTIDDLAIPFILTGAYLLDKFMGNPSDWHTTYQHPSQSALNNPPRGFNPREPRNTGGAAGWAIKTALAYKLYDTYIKQNKPAPESIPAVDNTYVAPPLNPYKPN